MKTEKLARNLWKIPDSLLCLENACPDKVILWFLLDIITSGIMNHGAGIAQSV
jgi:hypothetical protein